jgi:RimJ/RimL family protein N-acetyltransferase
MIIRPIRTDERERFAYLPDREQKKLLMQHLDEAFDSGATSEPWCLVAERGGRWVGRVFLRCPAGLAQVFVHFFDVALDEADADEIAQALIGAALAAAITDDDRSMLYALDVEHYWHPAPARRRAWFEDAGFNVARDAQRWEWPPSHALPQESGRLTFRTLDDVGEDAFRDAIARVSDGTLDERLQEMRKRLGRDGDAAEHFRLLTGLRYDPAWFQLGFDNGELVGLVAAGGGGGVAFIAYVGVVPEMRGRGYVNELLARGTNLLVDAGEAIIRADTDVANTPMANAFARTGYLPFMTRTEFVLFAGQRRKRPRPARMKRPPRSPGA